MVRCAEEGVDNGAAGSINRGVKGQPLLKTERLLLRPLMVKDAITLRELASGREIAYMTKTVSVKEKGNLRLTARPAIPRPRVGTPLLPREPFPAELWRRLDAV